MARKRKTDSVDSFPARSTAGIITVTPYGHQAECYPRGVYGQSNLSGYCADPDAALADLTRPTSSVDVPDGTVVLDKRPVLSGDGAVRASFGAPMLRLVGAPRPRPSNEELAIWASFGPEAGSYAGIAAGAIAGQINLDECNLDEYVRYWRGVGARVGHVRTVDGHRSIDWT